MGNCILTSRVDPTPIGSIYMTTNMSFNPNAYFGGTWTKIASKLPIGENVFGNGKALAMTNGSTLAAFRAYNNSGISAEYGKFGVDVGASSDGINLINGKATGVPTKTQLGSNLSNSGLIIDSIDCNIWKRTA